MQDLIYYRQDIYSQGGEDGVLEQIFETIGATNKWCVEFGAWDGIQYSNTRALTDNGWKAVLIEADGHRFNDLLRNMQEGSIPINARVGFGPEDNLTAILKKHTTIPIDFDLLSIDIDSDDYLVWEAFEEYKPRVVVIESNPTFPMNVEFVQHPGLHFGNSALALWLLGLAKGYKLVAYTTNCIFVRKDLADAFPKRSFAYLFQSGSTYTNAVVSSFRNENCLLGGLAFGEFDRLLMPNRLLAHGKHLHIREGEEIELLFADQPG